MDLSLIITLGLIFLITLIGAYVRSTVRDRCLKSFVQFNVTLELANGKIVWGKMRLEPTGLDRLLTQMQAYDEAERWLQVALSVEESLPDGGRRARMQMRELERRRTGEVFV